ncbi:MAG: efflux transporter periplasmic adaptor subunit [Thiothrix sp.]|nr:MAG: efflux transporter periplasmic adaptor subunit [Thiothrix sp.]
MKLVKILLPLALLAAGIGGSWWLMATSPKSERKTSAPVTPLVEVMALQPQSYSVTIKSRGTVTPRTQSTLVAEISGKITEVTDKLREGGFFEPDDLLVSIDPRDYESAVTIAQADLAQQKLSLNQEKARSRQANEDWQRLGSGSKASDLVLRKPQMASSRAAVSAADSRLTQARTDLARTRITAPYAGRVLEKKVDVGQYVRSGEVLASIYAIDYVEVKLPLSASQLEQLQLPEHYRGEKPNINANPAVTLISRSGSSEQQWQGQIVRSTAAIDTRSRQQFVVAQVDDPYARNESGRPPLKMGSFVEAKISGKTFTNVFVIPRSALHEGRDILLAVDGKLKRQAVNIVWSQGNDIVVSGLQAGAKLITTPPAYAIDGADIKIKDSTKSEAEKATDAPAKEED